MYREGGGHDGFLKGGFLFDGRQVGRSMPAVYRPSRY
jgi:hypothetical protein